MRITLLVVCLWLTISTLNAKIVFRSKRDGGHEIYTMNSDGTNPTRITHDPTSALSPSWSPNGRQIVYHSTRGSQVVRDSNIWVIDTDGENLRQLTHHPEWDNYPDWSPDGNQIAFDSDRLSKEGEPPKTEIYVMDTDGGNESQSLLTACCEIGSYKLWRQSTSGSGGRHDSQGSCHEVGCHIYKGHPKVSPTARAVGIGDSVL